MSRRVIISLILTEKVSIKLKHNYLIVAYFVIPNFLTLFSYGERNLLLFKKKIQTSLNHKPAPYLESFYNVQASLPVILEYYIRV